MEKAYKRCKYNEPFTTEEWQHEQDNTITIIYDSREDYNYLERYLLPVLGYENHFNKRNGKTIRLSAGRDLRGWRHAKILLFSKTCDPTELEEFYKKYDKEGFVTASMKLASKEARYVGFFDEELLK